MDKNTQDALTGFTQLLRALGAPAHIIDGLHEDCETVYGLPGQGPQDPDAAKKRMDELRSSLSDLGIDMSSRESLKAGLTDALKARFPNAQIKVIDMGTARDKIADDACGHELLLRGLVHDLKKLDLPAVNGLRSYRAALEILPAPTPEPTLSAEQQALISGLEKAGASQEIINELRAQFLGVPGR